MIAIDGCDRNGFFLTNKAADQGGGISSAEAGIQISIKGLEMQSRNSLYHFSFSDINNGDIRRIMGRHS